MVGVIGVPLVRPRQGGKGTLAEPKDKDVKPKLADGRDSVAARVRYVLQQFRNVAFEITRDVLVGLLRKWSDRMQSETKRLVRAFAYRGLCVYSPDYVDERAGGKMLRVAAWRGVGIPLRDGMFLLLLSRVYTIYYKIRPRCDSFLRAVVPYLLFVGTPLRSSPRLGCMKCHGAKPNSKNAEHVPRSTLRIDEIRSKRPVQTSPTCLS